MSLDIRRFRKFTRLDRDVTFYFKVIGHSSLSYIQSLHQEIFDDPNKKVEPLALIIPANKNMPPGTVMSLLINFRTEWRKMNTIARVSWCKPSSDGMSYIAGVEFVAVKDGLPDVIAQDLVRDLIDLHSKGSLVGDGKSFISSNPVPSQEEKASHQVNKVPLNPLVRAVGDIIE